MPRYNHAFTLAFSVDTDHPAGDDVTAGVVRGAILTRLSRLCDSELMEAIGAPFDSYALEDGIHHDPAHSANMRDALVRAERFITGFEDDPMQEGVTDLLARLRAALGPPSRTCGE